MAVRTVSVALRLQVNDFVAGAGKAVATTKALSGEFDTLAKTNKARFADVTKVAAGAGLALVGIAGAAVKMAADFDKQMSQVQSVSNATGVQLEDLRNAAITAGKQTMFSATDAADAESELAKAGVKTADILGGALSGSLSLAAAGQLNLADAATYSAQAMNMFGLSGKDVGHIADVLTAGANTSATDVAGLAQSLNQAGLVAHQTGLSLEDTVGALADFAQNGLVGSDAGTSFKTMLQALQAPSGKTADLMRELGISAYDASGKFIGITGLAQQLQTKLGGLTQAQRDAALAQIFGSDAVRAASILYKDGAAGLQKWIDGVNQTGIADKTASKLMDNLSGDVNNLKSSIETLAIQAGGSLTGTLRTVTHGVTDVVNAFADMPPGLQSAAEWMSLVGGASLLAGTGFVKARAAGKDFLTTLKEMGPAGERVAGMAGKVGSIGGELGILGAAAVVAGGGIHYLIDKFAPGPPVFKVVTRDVNAMTASLQNLAETGKVTSALAAAYGANLSGLAEDLTVLASAPLLDPKRAGNNAFALAAINEQLQATHHSVPQATADLKGMNDLLIGMVTNGGATQADLAFGDIRKQLLSLGVPLSTINGYFAAYITKAGQAAAGSSATAKGFATASSKTDLMSRSLSEAIDKLGSIDDAFKELNGGNIGATQANIAFKQSLADLTAGLKTNGDTLNINTKKGRDNTTNLLASVQAAEKAAQATYDQTGSVDKASSTYDTYIGQIKESLRQEGFKPAQIAAIIKQYALMPPLVSTVLQTPGLGSAIAGVRTLRTEIAKLHGKTVNVTEHFSSGESASANRWGGAYEHAAVGTLRDASVYGATSPGRYFIAEPQTGGEAFVPKRGDYGRSMGILSQAAGWYGASVVTGGVGGGSGGGAAVTFRAEPGAAAALVALLRVEIGRLGGDPVKVLTAK